MGKKILSKEEVEKNYEVFETKVKRDKHPNQWKYPGRSGNEHKMALMGYLKTLTPEQYQLFTKNQLVLSPEKVNSFLSEVKIDDYVGVKHTIYKVLSKNNDGFSGEDIFSKKILNISSADIDYGLANNFAEILWRDEKPYGVDEEETIKIIIPKSKEKVKTEETTTSQIEEK